MRCSVHSKIKGTPSPEFSARTGLDARNLKLAALVLPA
jgi:hypothetical protein